MIFPGSPVLGPGRIALAGWGYCWLARWWMPSAKHRKLVALYLKKLRWCHLRLPGYRTCMRFHHRSFRATLRKAARSNSGDGLTRRELSQNCPSSKA